MKLDKEKLMESMEEAKKIGAELAETAKDKAEVVFEEAASSVKKMTETIQRDGLKESVAETVKKASDTLSGINVEEKKEVIMDSIHKVSDSITSMTKEERKEAIVDAVVETKNKVVKATAEVKESAEQFRAKLAVKEIYLQFNGKEVKETEILEKVEQVYLEQGNKLSDLKNLELYIKPEDNAVFYVINSEKTGKIDI